MNLRYKPTILVTKKITLKGKVVGFYILDTLSGVERKISRDYLIRLIEDEKVLNVGVRSYINPNGSEKILIGIRGCTLSSIPVEELYPYNEDSTDGSGVKSPAREDIESQKVQSMPYVSDAPDISDDNKHEVTEKPVFHISDILEIYRNILNSAIFVFSIANVKVYSGNTIDPTEIAGLSFDIKTKHGEYCNGVIKFLNGHGVVVCKIEVYNSSKDLIVKTQSILIQETDKVIEVLYDITHD